MPLVSVIVPVFNDEKFIGETLQSICSQSYTNLEVIVIDDFSSDSTLNIVRNFKDKRIRIIQNKKNCGAAYARNIGISASNGEYISFLDGDDVWEREKVAKQLLFMQENNYVFSCTAYQLIDENSKPFNRTVKAPKRINHKAFIRSNYVGCLTVMYKKSIYPNLSIPTDIPKRNDYALWLKLSEKCDCYFLNESLARYRKRSMSISSDKKYKVFKSHMVLFEKLYNFSKFKAFLYSIRNVIYFFFRRFKYKK